MSTATQEVQKLIAAGFTVQDLLTGIIEQQSQPSNALSATQPVTLRDFYEGTVVRVSKGISFEAERGGGTFRTYESYWRLLVYGYPYPRRTQESAAEQTLIPEERLYAGLGHLCLNTIRASDLKEALQWVDVRAKLNAHWRTARRETAGRTSRPFDQRGARRNAIGAFRHLFALAETEAGLSHEQNPAATLKRGPKAVGNRRALSSDELEQLWQVVCMGGDDPALDSLLVECVLVTGARRAGLIALSLRDLDEQRGTIVLREKGERVDEQPATVSLVRRLREFAETRGSRNPGDPVFNFSDAITLGRPHRITSRRFDTLHARIQREVAWADRAGVTLHWLRHHAITQIERVAGPAVAEAFARHANSTVTAIYTKASMTEVCRAVGTVTQTEHPLSCGGW